MQRASVCPHTPPPTPLKQPFAPFTPHSSLPRHNSSARSKPSPLKVVVAPSLSSLFSTRPALRFVAPPFSQAWPELRVWVLTHPSFAFPRLQANCQKKEVSSSPPQLHPIGSPSNMQATLTNNSSSVPTPSTHPKSSSIQLTLTKTSKQRAPPLCEPRIPMPPSPSPPRWQSAATIFMSFSSSERRGGTPLLTISRRVFAGLV
ncbi:unnamed protein product [Chondrus crispus]|uniref:Uncharacterized protein n=1 Tax=Chondrus crispus TaxID=2769 RepID=R7QBC5_CHOCR|nr:unnamed protein product [Chondrus crispus]CDF35817.1 unnamed protein product [Chondrus crispus]|eukprot:XP_005715636.1 unnamed protein product [Chondrus crispus]